MSAQRSRGRRLPALAAMPVVLAIAGCDGCYVNPLAGAQSDGAVITTSAAEAPAGSTIVLDASGSSIGSLTEGCPMNVSIYDEATMTEIGSRYADSAERLQTVGSGKSCKVVNGKFPLVLSDAFRGDQAVRTFTALVEFYNDDGGVRSSKASVKVKVTPAGTKPAGTTPPTGGGTTTPPAQQDPAPAPSGCAKPVSTGVGSPPTVRMQLNPTPSVVGKDTYAIAGSTRDPEGQSTIKGFRFDWDGNGTFDYEYEYPYGRFTPDNTDPQTVCVQARDADGNTGIASLDTQVKPAGYLYNDGSIFPLTDDPAAGSPVEFYLKTPASITGAEMDYGDGTKTSITPSDNPQQAFHTYAAPGFYKASLTAIRGEERSTISEWVEVGPGSRPRASIAARKKAKPALVPFDLKATGAKVLSAGKVALVNGDLTTTGATALATVKGKLPRKLRKAKGLKGLKALTGAKAVTRFDGTRVLLTPNTWGIAGKGLILAQSRKSKRTRVCIAMTSDGRTTEGTRWTIRGATGKAKGLTGGGTMTPLRLGPDQPALAKPMASVRKGKAKGIGGCKALVKLLK